MTAAKKWTFCWVITWKFLFSGGRDLSLVGGGGIKIWSGSLLQQISKFLASGGTLPQSSLSPQ